MTDVARPLRMVVDTFEDEAVLARFVADDISDDEIPSVGSAVAAVPLDLDEGVFVAVDPRDPSHLLELAASLPAEDRALEVIGRWLGPQATANMRLRFPEGRFGLENRQPDQRAAAGRLAGLDWVRANMPVPTEAAVWALEETVLACKAADFGLDGRARHLIANLPGVLHDVKELIADDDPVWRAAASSAVRSVVDNGPLETIGRQVAACLRRAQTVFGAGTQPSGVFPPVGDWSVGWNLTEPGVLDPRERTITALSDVSSTSMRVSVEAGSSTRRDPGLWARAIGSGAMVFARCPLERSGNRFTGNLSRPDRVQAGDVEIDITPDPYGPVVTRRLAAISGARRAAFRAMFHERRNPDRTCASRWWESAAAAWAAAGLLEEASHAGRIAAEWSASMGPFLAERLVDPDLLDGPPGI